MTLTPTGSPFYLQIGGVWVLADGVRPAVSITMDRPGSMTKSLGGVVRTQVAPRSSRTWEMFAEEEDAEFIRYLALAAQGLVGDVFLYDAAAAQVNMLDPRDCIGRDLSQPTIVVNGLVPLRTFTAGYTLTMKLRAGIQYHLSGTTSDAEANFIGFYEADAGAVAIVAPAGTGPRRWSTSFMPSTDTTVTVTILVAGVTSALRLTEGSVDTIGFVPGQKAVCQISVGDPQQVLNMVSADRLPLSDWSVNLIEVG